MVKTNSVFKKILCCMGLWLLLTITSCGRWNDSESADGREPAGEEAVEGTESGRIAVADFWYMKMTYPLNWSNSDHTINGEWLYFSLVDYSMSGPPYTHISRKRMSDGYLEESYIISEKPAKEVQEQIMLADETGNCYIFWEQGSMEEEEDISYFLTKYGTGGELLWHADYTSEELWDMGESLYQGTVTADGRVFLYTHGSDGRVFAFGNDGDLKDVYIPDLEWLEGVAVGKGGKVYGYGSTANDFFFMELGGTGEKYACPVYPLEAYNGYEEGVCLRTQESMWRYDPETGEMVLLWNWADEYMQLDGGKIEGFFYDGETCRMLFAEQEHEFNTWPILTFVSVTFEDRQEYPGKQTVTLASLDLRYKEYDLDILVKLYNRQSKKYNVEVVPVKSAESLNLDLLQGKGEDLIDLDGLYGENLAEFGALEDLTAYYSSSGIVEWEGILEPIREACVMRGRNVAVIPSFQISTMLERENWHEIKNWTVWEFLKMGQEGEALPAQNPMTAFRYCMGIRYGERFVDYENKECRFDSDEFRRILEECGKWESYPAEEFYSNFASGDHLLETLLISTVHDMVWDANNIVDRDFSSRMVGFPGWEGGEYALYADVVFAMNSASEQKEGAWDFLEYLLSGELQDMAECWCGRFPVRTDSFEACLANPYYNPMLMASYDYTEEEPVIPMEKDIAALRRMIDSAIYRGGFMNNPVLHIVNEEAQMYFAGDCSLDETVRKIQSRVQLFLDEM